jgi:hypothetical protein
LAATGLFVVRSPEIAPPKKSPAQGSGTQALPQVSGYGPDPTVVNEEGQEVEPKRLADAFEAATGHRTPFSTHSKMDDVRTIPLRIIQLPFGPVLLTEDTNTDGHADVGAIGVYYLKEARGKFQVTGRWPRAVEGWDWGAPPDWRLTHRFTAYPAIYAWGDYMGQGIILKSATLTELRPDGPATSDLIGTGYDDDGHVEEGHRTCVVNGKIANIRRDISFEVLVTGSVSAVERYVKRNGRFVVRKKIQWDLPCGYRD